MAVKTKTIRNDEIISNLDTNFNLLQTQTLNLEEVLNHETQFQDERPHLLPHSSMKAGLNGFETENNAFFKSH